MGLFDFSANIGKKNFGIGDADASEKVVLMAGNMKGVDSVNAEDVSAPEAIAEDDSEYYVIEDPDLIFPGQKIRIPKS